MIQVDIYYVDNSLSHLMIKGHGGLEYGKDVICAGVSACLIGALNALNNAENYNIVVKEGYCLLDKVNDSTTHDEVVLETLIVQLQTIEKSYSNRIKINVSGKEGNK